MTKSPTPFWVRVLWFAFGKPRVRAIYRSNRAAPAPAPPQAPRESAPIVQRDCCWTASDMPHALGCIG